MPFDVLAGLATANFIASVVPGQNTALVASSAAQYGLRASVAVICGVLIADLGWTLLAILMLNGLLMVSPRVFALAEMAGGVVVILIGLWFLLSLRSNRSAAAPVIPRRARLLVTGLVVGFANPIALVFFVSILPQFLAETAAQPVLVALCLLAIVLSSAAGLVPYVVFSATNRTACERLVLLGGGLAMLVFGAAVLLGDALAV